MRHRPQANNVTIDDSFDTRIPTDDGESRDALHRKFVTNVVIKKIIITTYADKTDCERTRKRRATCDGSLAAAGRQRPSTPRRVTNRVVCVR